jgi:CBS domain-containing protein
MNEIPDIERFLRELPGFDQLDGDMIRNAAQAISVAYYRQGRDIMQIGDVNSTLHIVRSGAIELRDEAGDLVARLAEGDCFGFPSLMNNAPVRNHSTAIEDALLYHLHGDAFRDLRSRCTEFDTFFNRALSHRVHRQALQPITDQVRGAAAKSVSQLITRGPVTIDASASIRDTAAKMVEERVSAMLITRDGQMAGIVTDRDLRSRVVASNFSSDSPVEAIMTTEPTYLDASAPAYEAALLMMQNNIHHLPITGDGALLGLVSRSDFMRLETEHPLYLVSDLAKQTSAKGLADVCARLPGLISGQIDADVSGEQLGKFITAITDTITKRLIRIAEAQLGPAPCRYAWIALGSQARHEQSAKSDQDNGLVLEDSAGEAEEAYFVKVAKIVNDGLNECGYVYCPGDVMASNPKWRTTISQWKKYFHTWITVPEEKALMHANIFFDLRAVDGEAWLVEEIKDSIRETAQKNELFLALMAKNTTAFQPPLGFFRQFVLDKSGEHRNTLDLKLHGIMPIVEIARIRSLAAGEMRVTTRNRLRAAARHGELSELDAISLIDALDFIENLRLEHQSRQMESGQPPDNRLAPSDLSPLMRQNLKAAFSQIRTSQLALLNRYHLR